MRGAIREGRLYRDQAATVLAGELEADVFAKKQTELRDRLASLKLQLDAIDRSNDEMADLVSKVFELSQPFARNGLQQITTASVESSKSSV